MATRRYDTITYEVNKPAKADQLAIISNNLIEESRALRSWCYKNAIPKDCTELIVDYLRELKLKDLCILSIQLGYLRHITFYIDWYGEEAEDWQTGQFNPSRFITKLLAAKNKKRLENRRRKKQRQAALRY